MAICHPDLIRGTAPVCDRVRNSQRYPGQF
jgi:hypothetical protein